MDKDQLPLLAAQRLYKPMISAEKLVVIDVDGTLADLCGPGCCAEVVQKIRDLKGQSYRGTSYTSRNMRTYAVNIGRAIRHTAPILVEWLAHHKSLDAFWSLDERAFVARHAAAMTGEKTI